MFALLILVRKKTQTGANVVPKTDGFGNPVQTDRLGSCSRQGCPYPRRIDKSGKVLDYCSKGCAKKDSVPQASATTKGMPHIAVLNVYS